MSGLNLARRPFVNRRPVSRVTWILWALGGVCFLANVALYWNHVESLGDRRGRLEELDQQTLAAREEIAQTDAELAGLDLDWQNVQVTYLNGRIAERTFGWSRLFDRLEEVLPRDVRLERLTPRLIEADEETTRRGSRASLEGEERVLLRLDGVARTGEAVLELVDNLFAHPAFADPSPTSESRRQNGLEIGFNLTVVYLPDVVAAEEGPEASAQGSAVTAEPAETEPGAAAEPDGAGAAPAGEGATG